MSDWCGYLAVAALMAASQTFLLLEDSKSKPFSCSAWEV